MGAYKYTYTHRKRDWEFKVKELKWNIHTKDSYEYHKTVIYH